MGTTKIASTSGSDERREKRRAANRRSARKSRYREMVMLDELQRNSQELTDRNVALKDSNDKLRKAIASIKNAKDSTQALTGMNQYQSQNSKYMLLAAAGYMKPPQVYHPRLGSPADILGQHQADMMQRLGLAQHAEATILPALDKPVSSASSLPHVPIPFSQLAFLCASQHRIEGHVDPRVW